MLCTPSKYIAGNSVKIHSRSFPFAAERAVVSAKSRIYFCCYVLTANENRRSDPVLKILQACHLKSKSGNLDVRFSIDYPKQYKPNWNCNHHFMRWLAKNNLQFRVSAGLGTLHAKMILVDSSFLFIGSHNMAMSSFFNPLELTVEINDPMVVDSMAEDFRIWWKTLKTVVPLSGE